MFAKAPRCGSKAPKWLQDVLLEIILYIYTSADFQIEITYGFFSFLFWCGARKEQATGLLTQKFFHVGLLKE